MRAPSACKERLIARGPRFKDAGAGSVNGNFFIIAEKKNNDRASADAGQKSECKLGERLYNEVPLASGRPVKDSGNCQ